MGIEHSEVLGGSRPSKSPGEHTAHSWAVLTQTLTTLLEPHNLLSSSPSFKRKQIQRKRKANTQTPLKLRQIPTVRNRKQFKKELLSTKGPQTYLKVLIVFPDLFFSFFLFLIQRFFLVYLCPVSLNPTLMRLMGF